MAQQSPSSAFPSSSSSSFSYAFRYDVFLSFRGSDTRHGFTGNLYKALCDSGIHAFIDDKELKGGDTIKPSLIKAIKESRIAIPVFSENYAFSSFTLDELVAITEFVKGEGRLVLPVFYRVDPSHVRHQTESYGKALANHEERFQNDKEKCTDNMERMRKWKKALTQAADLSGKHFILGKEYEHEFIGKIIEEVSNKINHAPLHVVDYPVGVECRVQEVKSLLNVRPGSNDGVHMVGIYGIGGIGKTTLARAIYNSISGQFEDVCFLHNVREKSAKHGLEHLQEKLLSKTIGLKIEIGDVNEGIPIIKQRLHRKKVLLILDDIDKLEQLQDLAGGLDWFGDGSRVIITTRDKHLLTSYGIERTYEVDGLNREEALDLLRWKTSKNSIVDPIYEYLLNRVVTYASGLPLALEVVGSNLSGIPIEEWKYTLDWYERSPHEKIQNILKVSFCNLGKDMQSVFLDIACCFKGYKLAEVQDILHAHYGYCVKHHIRVLVGKSLIKIIYGDVTLHDLIEDMGKEIVRQESWGELGKRSRLWFHEDILHVLEENLGTSQIEIVYLDFPLSGEVAIEWEGDEFKKMKGLKTLMIKTGVFSRGPKHLPNSLRVLEWHKYPSQYLPSNFCPKKLSICKLDKSFLTSFALNGSLKAGFCEHELDRCTSLTRIPDVSSFPNLEKLSFWYCQNLIEIDDSVGFMNKLKILDAQGCSKLRSFPPIMLISLQKLDLSYCSSLENFPEILGKMENITKISLRDTSIEELPSSFENLTGLHTLQVTGHGMLRLPSSILTMTNLSHIIAQECRLLPKQNEKLSSMTSSNIQLLELIQSDLLDESLPTFLTWFANVTELNLAGNNFTILPECLKECHFLRSIYLDECKYLQEIRGIPPNLKRMSAFGCISLTSSCKSMLLNQELHEAGDTNFCFPGTARTPSWFEHKSRWFEHRSREPSISFWFRTKFPSIALFVANELMPNEKI